MAKRTGVCLLIFTLMFSALSTSAVAATSSPVIIQTGGLTGNILNIISALGGGTLLDSIPGTNIYLVNLPNLPSRDTARPEACWESSSWNRTGM